jgi:hypothetical protein
MLATPGQYNRTEAFLYELQRVTGENQVNYSTNQCYYKLIQIVHPDWCATNIVGLVCTTHQ